MTDPSPDPQTLFGLIGAMVAGAASVFGVNRVRALSGNGKTGLSDVVKAIRDEGRDTRAVIRSASERESDKIDKLTVAIAKLEGQQSRNPE